MSSETTESPLIHPKQDLLGFVEHAKELADFLTEEDLPLIVGIYGPWGAGKTSFANLIQFELQNRPRWQDAKYIVFSAWPYLTPDAIWQALIERIAGEICGQGRGEQRELETGTNTSWISRLRRALLSDALTLRTADSDPAKEKYDRLVQRLSIAVGIASRTASDRVSGLTAGRAAALFLDSAASVSPTVAPIRKLISGDGITKGLVSTDKPVPVLVQTIEDIRSDLQDLFRFSADTHLVVLIDDLDRCLPEVALDVLETVKIFFFESAIQKANCLFLITADERLLARGLRARLGGGEARVDEDSEARAYLEKLVQLGITLPEVEGVDSHRLVVGWAPEWTCAADLISQALDNNPRRIKQQTTLLSYHFKTRRASPKLDQGTVRNLVEVLAKLVRLSAVDRAASRQLAVLVRKTEDKHVLAAHEAMDPSDADCDPRTRLARTLRAHPEALRIFRSPPLLSELPTKALNNLLLLADMRVGSDGAPTASDKAFQYVYRAVVSQQGTTTRKWLDVSYVRRLLVLKHYLPALTDGLLAMCRAGLGRYRYAIAGLDKWLMQMSIGILAEPSPTSRELAEVCRPFLVDRNIYQLLLARPLISEIPFEYVEPVLKWAGSASSAAGAVGGASSSTDVLTAAALAAAEEVIPDEGLSAVGLRLDIAKDVFERRKFAKVRLLLLRWPMLTDLARGPRGLSRLKDLETVLLKRDPDASLPAAWADFQEDEALREFLRITPSFADIHEGELAKLAPTSAAVTIDSAAPPIVQHGKTDDVPPIRHYVNVFLRASTAPPHASREDGRINVIIEVEHREKKVQKTVLIPMQDITRLMELLVIRYRNTQRSRPTEVFMARPAEVFTASSSDISPGEVLADIGSILWGATLGTFQDLSAIVVDALNTADRVRIVVEADDVGAAEIPWECLYLPSHRVFVGQTLKLSVVRSVRDPVNLVPLRVGIPLRMLVVASDLAGLPLLGVEQEIELISRTLGFRGNAVRIDVLRSPTRQSMLNALQSYSPHIVHYMGHGMIVEGKGAVVLSTDDGQPDALLADELGLMLQDYGILLAILNGCVTGSPQASAVGQSVAQGLVRQGVPAAIATIRNVYDDAALRFSSEFYRAFVNGQPAEASLVEARKALGLAGFDWSAYVMYGSMRFPLQEIRVPSRVPMPFA